MISVLYVDDEPDLLDIGKIFLEQSGDFRVDLQASATGALLHLKTHQYDAIISDYMMTGMDGLEFLRRVRQEFGQIPFILFTGRGREEVVILALNNGADFYLQKGGAPQPQYAELAHKVRLAVQRRQAVVALEESERRYRDVVETQTGFISRFLPDGTHVFTNEAYCRYFGKRREEIVGHRFVPRVPPEDQERIRGHFAKLTPDQPSADIEHRVIMPDGTIRWHWWSDHAIFDNDGRIVEYQSAGKDITDRKRAEEALTISENLYRTVFDFTGNASIITAADTTILRANDGWEKLTGIPRKEQEDRLSWTIFIHKDDVEMMKRYHHARRKDPDLAPNVYESRVIDAAGNVHSCIVNVGMIPGTQNSVASLVDVTGRKKAEDELRAAYEQLAAAEEKLRARFEELKESQQKIRKSEKDYRSIFENIQDVFYRTDPEGNLVLVSPSGITLFGYDSAEEMYGRPVADTLYARPDERKAFLAAIEKDGSVFNYEVQLRQKDGTPITVITSSHKYYDTSGTFQGIEGIIRDITDRKQAEMKMKKSADLYRAIFDFTLAATVIIAPDTTILKVNTSWERLCGISRGDAENRMSWTQFIHADDLPRLKEYHYARRRNTSGAPTTYDCRVVDFRGEIHDCITYVDVIPETANSIASLIDVSHLKRSEDCLLAENRQLVAALKDLQEKYDRLRAGLQQGPGSGGGARVP